MEVERLPNGSTMNMNSQSITSESGESWGKITCIPEHIRNMCLQQIQIMIIQSQKTFFKETSMGIGPMKRWSPIRWKLQRMKVKYMLQGFLIDTDVCPLAFPSGSETIAVLSWDALNDMLLRGYGNEGCILHSHRGLT